MKVVNKTKYRTADLKALFHKAARHSPNIMDSGVTELTVEVVYSRGGISGYAYYGKVYHKNGCGYLMRIRVPNTTSRFKDNWQELPEHAMKEYTPYEWTPKRKRELAHTFIHELYHCAGVKHKDMRGGYFYRGDGEYERLAWADAFPVRRVEPKPGKSAEKRNAEKLAHAAKMLKKHESDLKRKQNLVKKWKRKVKYYENRDAKLAAAKGE